MRKILLSKQKAQIVEAPDPALPDGWVLVEPRAIPICGSDKGAYNSLEPCDWGGHEASGVIVASKSPTRKVGERVVLWTLTSCGSCRDCRMGNHILCRHKPEPIQGYFADRIAKPAHLCLPLPDDISFEIGSMACCALGPVFGASRKLALTASDTLLVTGLGPVGLGAVAVGKFH